MTLLCTARGPVRWLGLCLLVALLATVACSGGAPKRPEPTSQPAQKPTPQPTEAPTAQGEKSAQEQVDGYRASAASDDGDGRARYGRPLSEDTPEVAFVDLLSAPDKYADKTIRTSGVVARVCEAMGCWMELRGAAAGSGTLRAPMAGHAFFLPQSAVGKAATIEGPVRIAPLTAAQKAHYRAEGMQAVDKAASIDAEAVVIAN